MEYAGFERVRLALDHKDLGRIPSQRSVPAKRKYSKEVSVSRFKISFVGLGFVSLAIAALLLFVPRSAALRAAEEDWSGLKLWYEKPASQWIEALPLGNGRLGAMVYGGVEKDEIALNEDTVWTGGPYEPSQPEGPAAMPEIQSLIWEGKYRKAQEMLGRIMSTVPRGHMKYQPLGTLRLEFPDRGAFTDYRRDLDLDSAIASVSYRVNGVGFKREILSSPVDQVIAIRLTADQPGKVSFTARITGAKATPPGDETFAVEPAPPDSFVLKGKTASYRGVQGRVEYRAVVKAASDGGKISVGEGGLTVTGANAATLLIPAATNFVNFKDVSGNPETRVRVALAAAEKKSYEQIRRDHLAEHRRLFRRVKLDLPRTRISELPTGERLRRFPEGNDPQLAALYFQFGRYLLMSSSRPGTQPANLQGLWNDKMNPSWDSKFTTNINLEMNYWPAEVTNLSECAEPLFAMIKGLSETGSRTAKLHYGASGWVHHFNTDIWLPTAPMGGGMFSSWHTAGAWLCTHLWEHYLYTGDKKFLQDNYPIMKGAAQFFVDTLVEHPQYAWLVTSPSHSPENWPKIPGNRTYDQAYAANICAGPTMDMQLVRDLFDACISSSQILGADREFAARLRDMRRRLAPSQIGKYGQLQEWLEDWDDPTDTHRHLSHLYGLYPGHQITLRGTPWLAAAARQSLIFRGGLTMGWSRGWKINLWARLEDGERAYEMLRNQLRLEVKEELQHGDDGEWHGGTYPDLFSCGPPMQVDGNFSGCSGIAEMLLQSYGGEISLLPALPGPWPEGSVKGLRARGGFEVDVTWNASKVTRGAVRSALGGRCRVRAHAPLRVSLEGRSVKAEYPTELAAYGLKKGMIRPTVLSEFETAAGKEYVLSILE
jgi:alpha-L-fucosidase 2